MHILLCVADASLRIQCESELGAAGHQVHRWSAGEEVPEAADLAIIEGLEDVVVAYDVPIHVLALVEAEEVPLFPECPREVTDFAIKPLRPVEIVARAAAIASMPSFVQQNHNRLLALAVHEAGDIIELANPENVLEYVNPAYEETLGIPLADAVGKTPAQLVRSEMHEPEFFEELDQILARGDAWSGVLISRARDGRLVHLDSSITPVANSKGDVTHHLSVKRDITERLTRQEALERANRALEKARDAAVAASRAKSEFLANMSHELRTPLNAIIGYSEMLMEDFEDSEQVTRDLGRIKTAGGHLLALISDVLDISKIEAEKVDLVPERFSLEELLADVGDTVKPLLATNENDFRIDLRADVGQIYCDRIRLKQVLLNILSNAAKFTKQGTVSLETRSFTRDDGSWIEIAVHDDGVGIAAEHQAKLFRPFMQADSSTTREFGGTGLGLVICKRLVSLMGGDIELSSELGKGTSCTVRLPAQSPPVDRSGSFPQGSEPRVLLVDDDSAIRDLYTRTLGKRGLSVQVAKNGPEGLELAERLKPDIVVLDVKMPGMDGWEVLSNLKISESTAGIPVIMLTVAQELEVGKALGAVEYLVKPVDPEQLSQVLHRHLANRTAARVPGGQP